MRRSTALHTADRLIDVDVAALQRFQRPATILSRFRPLTRQRLRRSSSGMRFLMGLAVGVVVGFAVVAIVTGESGGALIAQARARLRN